MTPDQFAYWLQGFAELNEGPPNEAQWKSIQEHLQTVFVKVTPPIQSGTNQRDRASDNLARILKEQGRRTDSPFMSPYTTTCSALGITDSMAIC